MDKDKKANGEFLLLVTRQGVAKKVSAESFKEVRRSGLIAIKLGAGDSELYSANFLGKTDDVIVATKKGQSIRFKF
ncbi:MAG: DNA gyrase C-terminal beta-propeller domain-containing protein [Candidatus Paceibacterota bacterium]